MSRFERDLRRAEQSIAAKSAAVEKRQRTLDTLLGGPGMGITARAKRALLLVAEGTAVMEQAICISNPDIYRSGVETELCRRINRRLYELLANPPDWCREIVSRIQQREEEKVAARAAAEEQMLQYYESIAVSEIDFLRSWYERRGRTPNYASDDPNAFALLADYFEISASREKAFRAAREIPAERFLKLIGK